jgi:hypothetical protein
MSTFPKFISVSNILISIDKIIHIDLDQDIIGIYFIGGGVKIMQFTCPEEALEIFKHIEIFLTPES